MANSFQLGEKCEIKSSKRIFAKEYVERGVPFWRSKDVIDKALGEFSHHELFISNDRFNEINDKFGSPKKGDLLISSVGNRAGQPYLVRDEGDFYFKDGNILWLSNFDGINPSFLAYWLKSSVGQKTLSSVMIGSAQKAITIDSLRKLSVDFPNEKYQAKAVELLEELDSKIEVNRQTNQILEQMAQALFKSWFVDFDPVFDNALASGIAVNDFPEALQKKALSRQQQRQQVQQQITNGELEAKPLPEDIQQLFPSEFEQTDDPSIGISGWIPKGWSLDSFAMVATLKNKSIHPKKEPEKLWAQFSLPAFDNGKMPTLDLGIEIKSGKYKLSENTVLVSKLNPHTPRIWMPKVSDTDVSVCSTEFMPFEPVNNEHRVFVYSLMNSESVKSKIASRVTGTTGSHQRVSPKEVAVMPVLLPSLECITSFSNLIKSSFDKVELNLEQNIELTKLRDTLLPKLISGELQLQE